MDANESIRERDRALVQRVVEGDAAAGARFVSGLTPIIRARVARSCRARACLGGASTIDDLVQDVFVRLFADRARVLRAWNHRGGLSLTSFVLLIARRQAADSLRSISRRGWREIGHDLDGLEALAAAGAPCLESALALRSDARKLASDIRDGLGPRGREVFERLYVRLEAPRAIAEMMGMSLTSVYQWRRRLAPLVRRRAQLAERGVHGGAPSTAAGRGGSRVRKAGPRSE